MYYKKPIKFFPLFLRKISAKILLKSYPNYQPVFQEGKLLEGGDRNCLDRWPLIKKEIEDNNIKSVIDLGSAEGFYVLRSAKECGCFAIGVDADIRRFCIAQDQLSLERIVPAGFVFGVIDNDMLEKIPSFDMVIFLSVMHHMMYDKGEEYCRNFMKALRKKINKVMIFEMGQSNELKNKWAKLLPDMGENPHEWIREFLLSAGFSSVTKIGESDSYKKDQNRAIFSVKP